MAELRTVELRAAWVWTCDNCGQENFGQSPHEFTDEEIAELREEHGIQPYVEGVFYAVPQTVTCPGCRSRYSTEPQVTRPGGGDDDEEESL